MPNHEETRRRARALGLRVLAGGGDTQRCVCGRDVRADITVLRVEIEHDAADIIMTVCLNTRWCARCAPERVTVMLNNRRFTGWRMGAQGLVLRLRTGRFHGIARRRLHNLFQEEAWGREFFPMTTHARTITVDLNDFDFLVPLIERRQPYLHLIKGA